MRHLSVYIAAAAMALMAGCAHSHEAATAEAPDDEHTHGDGVITLSADMASRFGVTTDTVKTGGFTPALVLTGTLTADATSAAAVVAPVSGTVRFARGINPGAAVSAGATVAAIATDAVAGGDQAAAAAAALASARRELDRVKALWDERLATASELNAAQAAYDAAAAASSPRAASRRAESPVSGTISALLVSEGEYVSAGQSIATVSAAAGMMLLSVDVPEASYPMVADAADARFSTAVTAGAPRWISALGGARLRSGAAMPAATRPGYVPVRFTLRADGIPSGSVAEVYLPGNESRTAVSVPRTALSEQSGGFYVYEALPGHSDAYRKLRVTTAGTDGERVEISSGLKGGEIIVTDGVTTVRMAEMQAVAPQGHSHNH